jgi:predicted ribosome quality control (RQC) complex YloA/Tae2 family protein
MTFSKISIASDNYEYLVDTGDGFKLSYESAEDLINEVNRLKKESEKISELKAIIEQERAKVDLVLKLKNEVIEEKNNKIDLLENIVDKQENQIEDLEIIAENSKPSFSDNLGWASKGAVVGAIAMIILTANL